MDSAPAGDGRVFFSATARTLGAEDEIRLLSVGVDIGSSTSHLVFSRIVLERLDNRYIVAAREVVHESPILLTPYEGGDTIDAATLGAFIEDQYRAAGIAREDIDTGALILTGVAVRRRNARAIGELFAREAGRFVAVSAGDRLETTMAAYGSGAIARSIRDAGTVMNIDLGGGTAKIAVCDKGRIVALTALDVGARLVALDGAGRIVRIEEAGRRFAAELGLALAPGRVLGADEAEALAALMADRLMDAIAGGAPKSMRAPLLRLEPLSPHLPVEAVSFSGGVSEYLYGAETRRFGDLGEPFARAVLARIEHAGLKLIGASQRIRATVIGASQYTIQVSGSTIFVAPPTALPLRNLAVIAPDFALDGEEIDWRAVATAVRTVLARLDFADGERPVAVFLAWRGSATYARLDAVCRGILAGLEPLLARGHPLVLAGDGDVGGLIGIHCREELQLQADIVSIDGLELKEFDFIDIGAMLESSGAVPVVIKSLIFPGAAG